MKTLWVCLANSKKNRGLCLAGKALNGIHAGKWIRPVSNNPGKEIDAQHYERFPTLHVIESYFSSRVPTEHQSENILLTDDGASHSRIVTKIQDEHIYNLVDSKSSLWSNGHSSSKGLNDRVLPQTENSSLRLILAEDCHVHDVDNQLRVKFTYLGENYNLSLTDHQWLLFLKKNKKVRKHYKKAVICVSLSEKFNGWCYKLASGFFWIRQ